ncbi:LVIVD repeat-containing protein [Pelagibius sp.]|uniref:LVIVD repeat-containing protein n=1 Tax=Pelagibius sp. TaxID=1931238 RepID=UPI00261AA5F4|nr:RNA polymerase subunit sigma-70 [Pelagibius sp.]
MDGTTANLARNIRRIGHLDLPGGGQVVVQDGYAYVGHMKPPYGTTILDVSDPAQPRIAAQIMLEGEASHTHKVRVVGDMMITNVEQNRRHFLRKGEALPELRGKLSAELGRPPEDRELAAALGVEAGQIAELDAARERGYRDGGFKVWDISDKTRPRELCHKRTFGFGTHRFDMDANYAYISTEMEGYLGNILVIYDLKDPANPEEISRWHMPGQHLAGGEVPTWEGYKNRLHHALRVGDELWAAVWHAGFRVVDVSDIARPRTVASHDYHPPFPEPTHTILPLAEPIGGRRIAVAVDEEHAHRPGRLHAFLWVFDVTDFDNITALSAFDVSELDSPWARAPGRFGAHQFREKFDSTLVYVTWFGGGLRVVDVADPFAPVEVAHFIPEPLGDEPSPQSNDVDVDDRGLIYLLDRNRGLDVLEMRGR